MVIETVKIKELRREEETPRSKHLRPTDGRYQSDQVYACRRQSSLGSHKLLSADLVLRTDLLVCRGSKNCTTTSHMTLYHYRRILLRVLCVLYLLM